MDAEEQHPERVRISLGGDEAGGVPRRKEVVIGRGTDCDVIVKDAKASRRHCRLARIDEGEGFTLEDLGSRNGTYVAGRRIDEPVVLTANQTFKIGDTVFYLA